MRTFVRVRGQIEKALTLREFERLHAQQRVPLQVLSSTTLKRNKFRSHIPDTLLDAKRVLMQYLR